MKTNTLALSAILVLFCLPIFSQVGINNTSPKSLLDIKASSEGSPSNLDGILIPRVNAFPAINPGTDQNGMMVFLTTSIGEKDKGFYYWDSPNDKWVSIGAEEWKPGINEVGDKLIYATRAKLTGTEMVITDDGRIGFGTNNPVERFEFRGPGDNDFQITSANTNPPNFILYNTGGTLDIPGPLAANGEIGSFIVKTHDGTAIRENGGFRFFMDGVATTGSTPSRFVINTTPTGSVNQVERIIVRSTGNIGFGEANPTASLHIKKGTETAGSAPLKFTSGINLTTPEAGAMEYDGTDLYFTPGASRQTIFRGYTNTANPSFGSIPAGTTVEKIITVTGATIGSTCNVSPNGTIQSGLIWNSYVSAINTVTVRITNITPAAITPTARTWKATVIQ